MNEIRYDSKIEDVDFNLPTVFLAGPTVRGNQPNLISWRFEAIKLFQSKLFHGNLIVPEFISKTESDKYRYDIPVWEFNGLSKCHVIMFWVPRTKELIGLTTNHEHGYWMARDRKKVVYGRPDLAYRITYLDIMWIEDSKRSGAPCPIYNTLEKTVDAALERFSPWGIIDIKSDYEETLEIAKSKGWLLIGHKNEELYWWNGTIKKEIDWNKSLREQLP